MELTQAEEILAQHKICRMRQSKKHKFRRAHGMQDTRSLIQCLMSTKATWHWREAAFGEWICSRVSEILFFLLKQTMTMRMSQHGNQWLNHDLVLVGLTQNRRLLGKPVVGEPRWLRLGKQNILQLFLDFCWLATGNWGEFCSCVGASKHRTLWLVTWCHLDTCQGAVYQQAPSLHLSLFVCAHF